MSNVIEYMQVKDKVLTSEKKIFFMADMLAGLILSEFVAMNVRPGGKAWKKGATSFSITANKKIIVIYIQLNCIVSIE